MPPRKPRKLPKPSHWYILVWMEGKTLWLATLNGEVNVLTSNFEQARVFKYKHTVTLLAKEIRKSFRQQMKHCIVSPLEIPREART